MTRNSPNAFCQLKTLQMCCRKRTSSYWRHRKLPETRQVIGAKEFALMKREAYLINVARGTLVDEAALAEALRKHTIAGAAIDVATEEPLPSPKPVVETRQHFHHPSRKRRQRTHVDTPNRIADGKSGEMVRRAGPCQPS